MERMVASCGRFERVDSSTDVRQRCLADVRSAMRNWSEEEKRRKIRETTRPYKQSRDGTTSLEGRGNPDFALTLDYYYVDTSRLVTPRTRFISIAEDRSNENDSLP